MLNPINFMIAAGFAAFIVLDTLFPARNFPEQKYWRLRGVIAALTFIALSAYSPFLWVNWLNGPLLFDLTGAPAAVQVVAGYAAIQFFTYWWHRALHKYDILWRVFHQMHHSVERMDAWGALYHHPLDVIAFTFVGAFALTMVVGIGPEAAAIVGVFGALAVFFTHANLKTPRWIGWVMQRPEAHGLHHQRGRHAGNYAELALWDRLFGTCENPKVWRGQAGFYDGASLRIGEMLAFRDVATPPRVRNEKDPGRMEQIGRINLEIVSALLSACLFVTVMAGVVVAVAPII